MGESFAQLADTVKVVASRYLPSLTQQQMKIFRDFQSNPDLFVQASYSPQSATVQGILKNMYDTFVLNLENMNHDEATSQHQYESLMDTKRSQIKADEHERQTKETAKAEQEEQLGIAADTRESRMEQLAADQDFFASSAKGCQEKASEWQERSRNRDEELAGVDRAIEILNAPEARDLFTHATATFAQTQATRHDARREDLARRLGRVALWSGNARVMGLVARAAATGQFDGVIESIDNMMASLKAEEQQDVVDRDNCIEKEEANHNKHSDLLYEIEQLSNKISKLESLRDSLARELTETQQAISDHETMMAKALEDRNADHDAFVQARSDDAAAVALLQQASEALVRFAKNNKVSLLTLAKPEFSVSNRDDPEAKFSGTGSHHEQRKGIVAILAQIQENLTAEIKEGDAAEAREQAEYEEQAGKNRAALRSMQQRAADLSAEKAEADAKISATSQAKSDTITERDSVADVLLALKPGCDYIRQNFNKRRSERRNDMEGLQQAKADLAGAK
mmetsp:Transcript_32955/g.71963  ORF Transcript_32955/g.71963 Transcript_32955/m.71963 type:complete len:512 (+) Transcript_32955:490-2025(+)